MGVQFDPWSGSYRFEADDEHVQEILADAVPADTRSLSEGVLEVARTELGLGPDVRLRWFASESETSKRLRRKHGMKGLPWQTFEADEATSGVTFGAEPTELWIRSTLDPLDAAEAVFHEARHAAQYADFLAGKAGALNMTGLSAHADQLAEIDARQWTREITGKLEAQAEERAEALAVASRPAPATRSYHYPSSAEAAMARRRDGFFQHKGRLSARCEHCDEITPLNTTHRCPAAHWRPR